MTESDLVVLLDVLAGTETTPKSILEGPWPDHELFAAISLKESGGNPLASHVNSNDSIDRGLWQINSVHEKALMRLIPNEPVDFRTACYTPRLNVLFAVAVFQKQGYKAWSTFDHLP